MSSPVSIDERRISQQSMGSSTITQPGGEHVPVSVMQTQIGGTITLPTQTQYYGPVSAVVTHPPSSFGNSPKLIQLISSGVLQNPNPAMRTMLPSAMATINPRLIQTTNGIPYIPPGDLPGVDSSTTSITTQAPLTTIPPRHTQSRLTSQTIPVQPPPRAISFIPLSSMQTPTLGIGQMTTGGSCSSTAMPQRQVFERIPVSGDEIANAAIRSTSPKLNVSKRLESRKGVVTLATEAGEANPTAFELLRDEANNDTVRTPQSSQPSNADLPTYYRTVLQSQPTLPTQRSFITNIGSPKIGLANPSFQAPRILPVQTRPAMSTIVSQSAFGSQTAMQSGLSQSILAPPTLTSGLNITAPLSSSPTIQSPFGPPPGFIPPEELTAQQTAAHEAFMSQLQQQQDLQQAVLEQQAKMREEALQAQTRALEEQLEQQRVINQQRLEQQQAALHSQIGMTTGPPIITRNLSLTPTIIDQNPMETKASIAGSQVIIQHRPMSLNDPNNSIAGSHIIRPYGTYASQQIDPLVTMGGQSYAGSTGTHPPQNDRIPTTIITTNNIALSPTSKRLSEEIQFRTSGPAATINTQQPLRPGTWSYDKPQLVNLHIMYLSDLPKVESWTSSVQYVISAHSPESQIVTTRPPKLLSTFNPKETTALPVVTKPAKTFASDSTEGLSKVDELQKQVFTHLSDLRLAKKCVAEDGDKSIFDEKFVVSLPKFEDYMVINVWQMATSYVTSSVEYTLYGQIYLPLNDPQWNKKVCTWPLVNPKETHLDVRGNGTFLFSLSSTPDKCQRVAVEISNKNSVTLSWIEPESDNGSPIKGYKVQFREAPVIPKPRPVRKAYGDSQGKPQAGDEFDWQTASNACKDGRYTIENLNGNTRYVFRVSAINLVGTGDFYDSQFVTTSPCEPFAPGKPRVIGRSPDGISQVFLQWEAAESNGADISGHSLKVKALVPPQGHRASNPWIDIGEVVSQPLKVPSDVPGSLDKVVYRAKITSLPISGYVIMGVAAINCAGEGPVSEEDPMLTFEWHGEVWEEEIEEPSTAQLPMQSYIDFDNKDVPSPGLRSFMSQEVENSSSVTPPPPPIIEPSITDLRREQETDYQVSLLHDEVKVLNTKLATETRKLKRFQDEIDEQESLAKMASQRMTAYGGDNPNLSKALADAQGKLDDLQQQASAVSVEVMNIENQILDKQAMLEALR